MQLGARPPTEAVAPPAPGAMSQDCDYPWGQAATGRGCGCSWVLVVLCWILAPLASRWPRKILPAVH